MTRVMRWALQARDGGVGNRLIWMRAHDVTRVGLVVGLSWEL